MHLNEEFWGFSRYESLQIFLSWLFGVKMEAKKKRLNQVN